MNEKIQSINIIAWDSGLCLFSSVQFYTIFMQQNKMIANILDGRASTSCVRHYITVVIEQWPLL